MYSEYSAIAYKVSYGRHRCENCSEHKEQLYLCAMMKDRVTWLHWQCVGKMAIAAMTISIKDIADEFLGWGRLSSKDQAMIRKALDMVNPVNTNAESRSSKRRLVSQDEEEVSIKKNRK